MSRTEAPILTSSVRPADQSLGDLAQTILCLSPGSVGAKISLRWRDVVCEATNRSGWVCGRSTRAPPAAAAAGNPRLHGY